MKRRKFLILGVMAISIIMLFSLGFSTGYSCGNRMVEVINKSSYEDIVYFDSDIDRINSGLSPDELFELGRHLKENKYIMVSTCRKTIWLFGYEIWARKIFPKRVLVAVKANGQSRSLIITLNIYDQSCNIY